MIRLDCLDDKRAFALLEIEISYFSMGMFGDDIVNHSILGNYIRN